MNWYLDILKTKYAKFDGRAHRTEFWMFFLFNVLAAIAISIVDSILGITFGGLGMLYSLAVFIPSIAVGARRLHDTGRSGWWQLIVLVPFVGWIVLLVIFVLETQQGDNAYGAQPPPAA